MTNGIREMAAETGNNYVSGITTDSLKIPTVNAGF